MEITTIQKNIHNSPRKVRLVADLIRKMVPEQAVQTLRFTNKAASVSLMKAIEVVLANAKSQNIDLEKVNFKTIEVNEGVKMRRFRAGTKGRAKPYRKRLSQIKIVLSDEIRRPEIVNAEKLEKGDK